MVRLNPDKPAGTILASKEPPLHYKYDRALTLEEISRLFSLPPGYVLFGSRRRQIRQIGNSVPVRLARAVADTIKLVLENTYEGEDE